MFCFQLYVMAIVVIMLSFFYQTLLQKKVIDVPKFKIKREHINLLVFFGFFCAYIVSRR